MEGESLVNTGTLMIEEDVRKIMNKHMPQLLGIKGVIGVGIGKTELNQLAIEVLVAKKLPEHNKLVPNLLEGVPVKIREVGVIRTLEIHKRWGG